MGGVDLLVVVFVVVAVVVAGACFCCCCCAGGLCHSRRYRGVVETLNNMPCCKNWRLLSLLRISGTTYLLATSGGICCTWPTNSLKYHFFPSWLYTTNHVKSTTVSKTSGKCWVMAAKVWCKAGKGLGKMVMLAGLVVLMEKFI